MLCRYAECLYSECHGTYQRDNKNFGLLVRPGGQCYKAYYVSYEFLQQVRAFVPGKPFQDSIVFTGKAGA
jgi:hypothetical protein